LAKEEIGGSMSSSPVSTPKPMIPCLKCSSPVEVDIGKMEVINMETVSMIVIPHSGPTICPSCLENVNPAIRALQGLLLVANPIPREQQKSMIVTPSNGNGKLIV